MNASTVACTELNATTCTLNLATCHSLVKYIENINYIKVTRLETFNTLISK